MEGNVEKNRKKSFSLYRNSILDQRSTLVYCGCFVRVQIDFTQIEAKQKKGETQNPIARRDFF